MVVTLFYYWQSFNGFTLTQCDKPVLIDLTKKNFKNSNTKKFLKNRLPKKFLKKKYGKNAIFRGMDLEEGATTMARNGQIGGHKA